MPDGMRQKHAPTDQRGDKDITAPMASAASNVDEIITELETTRVSERAGRAMDHEAEDAFERLRTEGYM